MPQVAVSARSSAPGPGDGPPGGVEQAYRAPWESGAAGGFFRLPPAALGGPAPEPADPGAPGRFPRFVVHPL
eukprot:7277190-Alexandrium_andersonii.AAC.1